MLREVAFISDACTLPGYIAASPGLYSALRFQYRPATMSERSAILAQQHEEPIEGFARSAATVMASKIVSWELPDRKAAPPISVTSMLSLHAELFRKLYVIVLGYEGSAIDPAWPAEIADEVLRDEAEATAQGRAAGDIGQERREKN